MTTNPPTDITEQKVSDAAARVLRDCIWDSTVECIVKYANANRVNKSDVDVRKWLKAIKATGGMIGIGWYNESTDAFAEYTLWDAASDLEFKLRRLVFNPDATETTYGTRKRDDVYPITSTTDKSYIKHKLNTESLRPICLTVDEIQSLIDIKHKDLLNLPLSVHRPHTVFDSDYTQGKHWREITDFTPVTDPAREIIARTPWTNPRNKFLSYGAANNPESFLPNPNEWVRLLQITGGQILIGWFTQVNKINTITYYDLDSSEGWKTNQASIKQYDVDDRETDTCSEYIINQQMNEKYVKPMCLSIHSSDFHTPHTDSVVQQ